MCFGCANLILLHALVCGQTETFCEHELLYVHHLALADVSGALLEKSDVPTSLGPLPTVGLTRVHFSPHHVSTVMGEVCTLSPAHQCALSLSLAPPYTAGASLTDGWIANLCDLWEVHTSAKAVWDLGWPGSVMTPHYCSVSTCSDAECESMALSFLQKTMCAENIVADARPCDSVGSDTIEADVGMLVRQFALSTRGYVMSFDCIGRTCVYWLTCMLESV